jgi:hypothetical protein
MHKTNSQELRANEQTSMIMLGADKKLRQIKQLGAVAIYLQFEIEVGARPVKGELGLKSKTSYESPLSVLTSKIELKGLHGNVRRIMHTIATEDHGRQSWN